MRSQNSGDAARLRQDDRFSAMFKDPRFHRFPKKKHKVVIDKRFAGVLEDDDFKVTTAVDKRGRKVVKKKENDDLKRYYRLKDEDEWRDAKAEDVDPANQAGAGAPEQQVIKATKKKAAKTAAVERDEKSKKSEGEPVPGGAVPKTTDKKGAGDPAGGKQEASIAKASKQQQPKGVAGLLLVQKQKPTSGKLTAPVETTRPSASEEEDVEEDEDGDEDEDEDEDADLEEDDAGKPNGRDAGKADKEYLWARARGLAGPSSSDEDDDESGEDEDEDEQEDHEADSADEPLSDEERVSEESMDPDEWGVGAYARDPDKDATLVDVDHDTKRIAIVDLDWDHVKAVDLLAVLRSFCPRAGQVEKVTIYFSDYGLQRLAEETVAGPQGIYKSARKSADVKPSVRSKARAGSHGEDNEGASNEEEDVENENGEDESEGEDDEDEDGDLSDGSDEMEAAKKLAKLRKLQGAGESDDDGEVDKVRLAMYERSKMRYYYAVAELDSPSTAAAVYAECDGLEFERSACKFDLRFVPDEESFEGRKVRDSATTIPDGYKPPSIFNTSLQHTDPKLTWDADDDGRKRALTKKMTEEELKDADFAAYLGSDDSGEEEQEAAGEDPEAIRKRYQSLLLGGDGGKDKQAGGKSWGDEEEGSSGEEEDDEDDAAKPGISRIKNDEGMEMEISFQPGLESLGQRLLDKKQEEAQRKGETVWEAYLRKKREKRLKKKMDKKGRMADSSDDDDDDSADGSGDDDDLQDKEGNGHVGNDPFFQHEDNPFDDPFFQGGDEQAALETRSDSDVDDDNTRKKKKKTKDKKGIKSKTDDKAKSGAQQKELELLMMDDAALHEVARGKLGLLGAGAKGAAEEEPAVGTSKGKLSKKEKRKQKVQAKKKAREGSDEEDLQDDGFQVNLNDPRFSAVLSSHHFAVDPTDPRFKKSKAAQTIMDAARKLTSTQAAPKKVEKPAGNEAGSARSREGVELKAMVAKLKRKSAQMLQGKETADASSRLVKQKRR